MNTYGAYDARKNEPSGEEQVGYGDLLFGDSVGGWMEIMTIQCFDCLLFSSSSHRSTEGAIVCGSKLLKDFLY